MRAAEVGDLPAVAAIYAPYVERTVVTFETEPPDAAAWAARFAAVHARCGFREVGRLERVGFKHGRRVDTVLMQREPGDAATPAFIPAQRGDQAPGRDGLGLREEQRRLDQLHLEDLVVVLPDADEVDPRVHGNAEARGHDVHRGPRRPDWAGVAAWSGCWPPRRTGRRPPGPGQDDALVGRVAVLAAEEDQRPLAVDGDRVDERLDQHRLPAALQAPDVGGRGLALVRAVGARRPGCRRRRPA